MPHAHPMSRGLRKHERLRKAGLKRTSHGRLVRVSPPTSKRRALLSKALAESAAARAKPPTAVEAAMLEVAKAKRKLSAAASHWNKVSAEMELAFAEETLRKLLRK